MTAAAAEALQERKSPSGEEPIYRKNVAQSAMGLECYRVALHISCGRHAGFPLARLPRVPIAIVRGSIVAP